MSDEKSNKISTREFISDRDLRIFKLRQAGTSTSEIARRFGVSTTVVSRAIQRQLQKMNSEIILIFLFDQKRSLFTNRIVLSKLL